MKLPFPYLSLTMRKPQYLAWLFAILVLFAAQARADFFTARQAMESQAHPLLMLASARGAIYLELFPAEAPQNVENFLNLVAGNIETFDGEENNDFTPGYFNGSDFHRVIPGLLIQAGSPHRHPRGMPNQFVSDEINASALGLDRLPVLSIDGTANAILNVGNSEEFGHRVLEPLYRGLNIDTVADLEQRQYDVASELQSLTVMRLYEYEGYQYQNQYPTRLITRGTLVLANDGPNRNGPEFFIALDDAEWLNGRYTVIGKVVEGMEVADQIGAVAVDPGQATDTGTAIYSMRRIN